MTTAAHPTTNGARPASPPEHRRVVVVGAGFGGLAAAARLKQSGIDDFVVLERADEVGGTWRENTYPGCQCDVPSRLYSLSFALNPDWSRTFSPQEEIQEYLRRVADETGARPHIRLETELVDARWDDPTGRWQLETSAGPLTAQFLISAPGGLAEPAIPEIPGLDGFDGAVFHSARWDHDQDLTGERVAVIGTGASAIQIVPRIQPKVAALHVFQRTPPWVMPHYDRPTRGWERRAYRALPFLERLVRAAIYCGRETYVIPFMRPRFARFPERIARRHLRRQVDDPALRAKLTPDYRIGCKRILPSNDYYPALTRPNVELVTAGIGEVRPGSIVTAEGAEREVDTIVLATGFHVTDSPALERIRGRDGRSLAELWQGAPRAHLGTTVAGYPNLFMLNGPGTGLGHNSIVFMIECQVDYILQSLRQAEERRAEIVEVLPSAQEASSEDADRRLAGSVWATGGCASWYQDAAGRLSTLWPGSTWRYRRRLRRFDPAEYRFRRPPLRIEHGRPRKPATPNEAIPVTGATEGAGVR